MLAYSLVVGCVNFADGLAIVASVLVIILAATETMKELKVFKTVMITNSFIDLGCSLINLFSRPHLEIVNGLWIHVLNYPASLLPKVCQYWVAGSYFFVLIIVMMCLPFSFYYRWRLLVKSDRIQKLELVYLIIGMIVVSFMFLLMFGYGFYANDWRYVDKSFLLNNPFIYTEQDRNPIVVVGELKSFSMMVVAIFTLIFVSVALGFIVYFSVGIIRELHRMRLQMRVKTQRLNKQMNLMFFTQTFAVFGAAMISFGLIFIATFFTLNIPGFGAIITIILAFVPAIDPVCILIIVSRFRYRIFYKLCCGRKRYEAGASVSDKYSSSANSTAVQQPRASAVA